VLETSGPVPAFTDAVQARDVNRIVGLLAHDVRLSVPPLHYTRRGTQDVVGALVALLRGFGELHYDVRSRYVAPGTVTDEVMLVGRQTGEFLGAEPGRGTSTVAARVIIGHDAATITAITVWPDVAALRTAVNGTSRLIDLTRVAEGAGAMVASLRASIPPAQTRLIIGSAREHRPVTVLPAPEPASHRGPDGPLAGRTVPRPPVPRPVRRRRALVAGSAMLVVSAVLTTWVAIGALRLSPDRPAVTRPSAGTPGPGRGPGGAPGGASPGGTSHGGTSHGGASPGAASPGAASPGGAGGASPAGPGGGTPGAGGPTALADATPQHLGPDQLTVTLDTDGLFEFPTDVHTLTPRAREQLDVLITEALQQHRHGTVRVVGFTDSSGSDPHNRILSLQRAQAVAEVLRAGLADTHLTVSRPRGLGSARPRADNRTRDGRAQNRRVEVTFPLS